MNQQSAFGLDSLLGYVSSVLTEFAADPLFTEKFALVFNTVISPQAFLEAITNLPAIEILPDEVLQGALGGFSAQTGKIYLSESLVSGNSAKLESVLLEEIGHYIDAQVNVVDTMGDEGELFSAIVLRQDLSSEKIAQISKDDDYAWVEINNELLRIEQANNYINSGTLEVNNVYFNIDSGIGNYGTININGSLYNYNGSIENTEGNVNNSGILYNDYQSYIYNNFGYIYNNGGTIYNNGGTIYNNDGTIYSYNNGTINNDGTIYNSGEIKLNFGTVDNHGTIDNGGTIYNNSGTINNGGTIYNNGGTIYNYNTITISNSGTINNGGNINNDGEITINSGTIDNYYYGQITISNSGEININGGTIFYNSGTTSNSGNININTGKISNSDTIYNYNTGNINNDGTIDNNGNINNYGTINNDGTIDSGTINNNGTINNDGTIGSNINNYGTIINNNTIDNYGDTIYNYNGGTINNDGTINFGYIYNNGGTIDNSGTIDGASLILNNGIIKNYNFGTVTNLSILAGSGRFEGDVEVSNYGKLAPGGNDTNYYTDTNGAFTIVGNLAQKNTGVLSLSLTNSSSFDVLKVTDNASFGDGSINLTGFSTFANSTFNSGITNLILIDGDSDGNGVGTLSIASSILTALNNTVNAYDTSTLDFSVGILSNDLVLSINKVSAVAPNLAIVATNANRPEGNGSYLWSTFFTFTVNRSGSTTGANSVNWTVTGTGTNPANTADFVGGVLPSGTVSFAAGETSKIITVKVEGDTTPEPNETFTVTLSNPTNGATIASASAQGTIQNDDTSSGNTFTGTTANNILNGTTGADTLIGLAGSDTYTVNNSGDVIVENLNEGTDTVKSSISYTLANNVEKLTLLGTSSINGTGNGLNNTLTGNTGNNTLIGLGGNDTIDGKTGADTMQGGLGNDTYTVDNIGDIVTENLNEGTDTVKASINYTLGNNVEKLTLLGTTNLNGIGNELNNTLTGNTGNNILNGGAGKDTLAGKAGSDTFVFRFGESTITNLDRVSDFAIGADKIDLLTQSGAAMNKPSAFFRAADSTTTNINTIVSNVFTDANGATAGNQALGINRAALVKANTATYLIINDGTAGFQSANDLVINLTGITGTLPALGTIAVNSFFI